ncbi:MAG: glycine--tRNA ligase [Candidatus Ryanbacteria bacterium RIFCSPLOWO2_01_FULL_48_26]|uniref:glycine--tRNA ligase n=1 Tax=Candidatus Ryanbacteria bacterium RIFCSPLOWO2_01_FULL_48_26 TaxID=1802126 RepID=A0A1G2GSL7_9BACT|nr:MAG: glycine--tRNA ligase [Candidatus Ryanbacteria bacterium RIFCSPLOWO2_01_FULL_48_26]
MDKIISLCKRRGFVFPGSEIHGGLANSWDYGPLGVELKNNIKQLWWNRFVHRRDDMVGIDAALIMNPKVWEASGHLKEFADPLIECRKCHSRFRMDQLEGIIVGAQEVKKFLEATNTLAAMSVGGVHYAITDKAICPVCKVRLRDNYVPPFNFNLMLKTFLGPAEETANLAYFRPETAQAMFVDFKQVLDTTRRRLPFGIAQVGKVFRNEITPGNFIFRTREFEQMEVEYFIAPPKNDTEWQKHFEHWQNEMRDWLTEIGVDMKKVHEREISEEDRAFYSKRTVDFEFDYPFGRKELYGLAYRTDYDLSQHEKFSGASLKYRDPETGEEFVPHVIEPSLGVDRTILVVLLSAYHEDGERVVLKLNPALAPYQAAVFPLLANKPELGKLAREIYNNLRKKYSVAWDDRGNIGKRYYSQDEIGTPFCITVDFDSLKNGDATVRDRDTAKQERIKINELDNFLHGKIFS